MKTNLIFALIIILFSNCNESPEVADNNKKEKLKTSIVQNSKPQKINKKYEILIKEKKIYQNLLTA